jgi:hypothetical protein
MISSIKVSFGGNRFDFVTKGLTKKQRMPDTILSAESL